MLNLSFLCLFSLWASSLVEVEEIGARGHFHLEARHPETEASLKLLNSFSSILFYSTPNLSNKIKTQITALSEALGILKSNLHSKNRCSNRYTHLFKYTLIMASLTLSSIMLILFNNS